MHVRTLVLHRTGDPDAPIEGGRYLGERIPGATFVELPGVDHFVSMDPDQIVDEVEEFVTGARPRARTSRVLGSILFSDVVGSTELARRLGDRAWAERLAAHDRIVADVLAQYGGELVDTAGDGILALFDGPARAIRCGLDLRDRLVPLELAVRVGIHTGEIEREQDAVRGIAVHLAARVAAEADGGEVLVTSTTHDLVEGSGITFAPRGERLFRGFETPRRVYACTRHVLTRRTPRSVCEHVFVPQPTVLHADLDSFYASVEQRDDASLREARDRRRGVVLAASYEAKAYGVRTAMGGRQGAASAPMQSS